MHISLLHEPAPAEQWLFDAESGNMSNLNDNIYSIGNKQYYLQQQLQLLDSLSCNNDISKPQNVSVFVDEFRKKMVKLIYWFWIAPK